jgi:hypothetical protein
MLARSIVAFVVTLSLCAPLASAQKRKLKPRGPVSCSGLGKKVVKNAVIRGDDHAVAVFGTCKITVIDSHLIGGKYAALNAGTGKLELINTTLEARGVALGHTGTGKTIVRGATLSGGRASVELTGTGKINASDSVFRGRKIHRGLGKLEIGARVRWEKRASVAAERPSDDEVADGPAIAAPLPGKLRRHRAIHCDKNQRVDLDGVFIDAPVAVMASGSCEVRLRNSEIVGGRTALMASGSSRITLLNSKVRSPRGLAVLVSGSAHLTMVGGTVVGRRAYDVSGSATVRAKNVTVRGPGSKSGWATLDDQGGNRFLPR